MDGASSVVGACVCPGWSGARGVCSGGGGGGSGGVGGCPGGRRRCILAGLSGPVGLGGTRVHHRGMEPDPATPTSLDHLLRTRTDRGRPGRRHTGTRSRVPPCHAARVVPDRDGRGSERVRPSGPPDPARETDARAPAPQATPSVVTSHPSSRATRPLRGWSTGWGSRSGSSHSCSPYRGSSRRARWALSSVRTSLASSRTLLSSSGWFPRRSWGACPVRAADSSAFVNLRRKGDVTFPPGPFPEPSTHPAPDP